MFYYVNIDEFLKSKRIGKKCKCNKKNICICDDMIINKNCICRMIINQDELEDLIEMAKIKNENYKIENNFVEFKNAKYEKIENIKDFLKEAIYKKADFLDWENIEEK